MESSAFFYEPIVVFGILLSTLALIFKASHSTWPILQKLFKIFPPLFLCYLIPALLSNLNIIADPGEKIYFITSRFLLPACIVLMILSLNLKHILELGPKIIILFLTGTLGVIIGGPVTLVLIFKFYPNFIPDIEANMLWRGMATLAGSWIGGTPNQIAIKEIFEVPDSMFKLMSNITFINESIWLALMFWIAGKSTYIDHLLKADSTALDDLKEKLDHLQNENQKPQTFESLITLCGIAFGTVALSYILGSFIITEINKHAPELRYIGLTSQFLWTLTMSSFLGILLSLNPRIKKLESYGASKIGTVFLYLLISVLGMYMQIRAIFLSPALFLIGFIWISIHLIIVFTMARALRAPAFYACIGSTANIGGAASGPIVAAAFHPSLAPVGVLLSIFGYALGTYGAWLCGQIMRLILF